MTVRIAGKRLPVHHLGPTWSERRRAEGSSAKRVRVLHVEDSPDDGDLIRLQLEQGGYDVDVLRVETAQTMRAALSEDRWDIVISDHSLPRFTAPEAFAVLRSTGLDLPFIIVSGTVGEEVAVEAMRSGVHDYVLKGNLHRLVVAVDRELREASFRAEQRRMREQLMISERLAAVGTLAAGIAHEINNPLSAIVGNVALLADDIARVLEPPDQGNEPPSSALDLARRIREPLADTQEAVERVRLIARDLRVFSRSDDDLRAPVDVRTVLDSAARMAAHEIRGRARMSRRYADVPPVDANEGRLGQVFLNLLVNAGQAIPKGNPDGNTIAISAGAEDERVFVEIADTGTGIPTDVLPRIFDLFYTTKPVGVGTGLGLAICHRIVTGLKGEITVDSTVGRGTTFRVSLPRRGSGFGAQLST
jgi:signal transduction histidine kinase